ncbi:lysophospholipid acyltransferase family protein [Falsirhodobacter algicola]|uniref:1-acyl-sn-glycerol-3-phosphate acyltransferase n=1 Tax=Falsirhodobacter algicola TaxID=2692330 RepID=A0A8J8MT93_9RHOB|nr:lysophospholipid acyltransferase family protein [Falsirhodobacter algicola]QUS35903.1 1-acyl-sn-glycerol-3-phosphate acyltransferase [Falsirhodobacter algicola]
MMLRSILFGAQMYVAMGVMGLIGLPLALTRPDGALRVCKAYCRWVLWTARALLGLEGRILGEVPTGPVLVAAKHQSFLDVILLFHALPQPRFIMKSDLARLPLFGWYTRRLGCIPVSRGGGAEAVARLLDAAGGEGQIVIYPQGTRVPVGDIAPYKYGVAALYAHLGRPCVPAATNAGRVWPRGVRRHAGVAVMEFLPPIAPGLAAEDVLQLLERRIEAASNRLA